MPLPRRSLSANLSRMRYISCVIVCALLLAGPLFSLRADELTVKGRAILEKNQGTVVTVQVVLKTSSSGSASRETKQDITGTVVDPSGLTVLALSACDPNEMLQRIMPEEFSKYNVQSEVSDLRILLEDGTDIAAEIVLRDKDLDLAFIRPKTKPATPMAAVNLAKSSPSPTATMPGAPAFSLDGNILGIFVTRAISLKGGSARDMRNSVTPIILPAEEILKAARQAPEAKPEGEKKTATTETKPEK